MNGIGGSGTGGLIFVFMKSLPFVSQFFSIEVFLSNLHLGGVFLTHNQVNHEMRGRVFHFLGNETSGSHFLLSVNSCLFQIWNFGQRLPLNVFLCLPCSTSANGPYVEWSPMPKSVFYASFFVFFFVF